MKAFTSRKSSILAIICMAALLMGMVLAVAACGGEATIVGKWVEADGAETEFTADGKVLGDDMEGMDATYVAEDGKLTVTVMGMAVTFDYELDGDTLKITQPESGEIDVLTRVK